MRRWLFRVFLVLALLLALTAATLWWYGGGWPRGETQTASTYATHAEAESVHVRLAMEAYDTIKAEYWQEVPDEELATLYTRALERVAGEDAATLASSTRAGFARMLQQTLEAADSAAAREEMVVNTLQVVLYNLAPAGRSKLLTRNAEQDLRDKVANRNPAHDLYAQLGLEKGAAASEVTEAFAATQEKLRASSSPEAHAKLEEAAYAHEVLTNNATKQRYDEQGVEPTVQTETLGTDTLYMDVTQVAPTTLQEFAEDLVAAQRTRMHRNLVLDLRGNIGGALDFTPYFLALFLGPHQYVADLFSRGVREPMRTPAHIPAVAELDEFQSIVLLVDEETKSTAELTAAAMKRLNLATVVGTTTMGWGTVENTFPLETTVDSQREYVLFLVHSVTLRDDQQPIEGRGVEPHVAVRGEGWHEALRARVGEELAGEIISLLRDGPP